MAKTEFPRPGAWAKIGKKVGIVTTIDGDAAEVHYVDELGETTSVVKDVPLASMKQASFEDIPVPRRPHKRVAKALGYGVSD